jgi:hypothetical protein
MKCHNCGISVHFGTFLKKINPSLYSQYSFERYTDSVPANKPHKDPILKFTEPKLKETSNECLLDYLLDSLDTLPDDNLAVKFCRERKIPEKAFKRLYFIENMKDIGQISPKMKDKITTNEPRLVIPFYDHKLQLSAVTCRALQGEKLRYVNVEIKEDIPLIFGLDTINQSKHIYVVEGPLDSLFLPNAIAVGGTGFTKVKNLKIEKDQMTLIVDNQPRNKEVCKVIENLIEENYNVVIWPQYIEEKDINEMVLAGRNVLKIIKENTFNGLQARVNFMTWKRC